MISRLRAIRLSWSQFLIVAATSALATALILSAAVGHPKVPSAAVIAALRHRVVIHRMAVAQPRPSNAPAEPAAGTGPVAPSSASSGDSTPPDASSPNDSGPASASSDSDDSSSSSASPASTAKSTVTPTDKVKHVFVIALSTTSYQAAWSHDSVARYLNDKLRPKGTLLRGYRSLGTAELPDYLAMISGQAPNPETEAECATYDQFSSTAKADALGQMRGRGCVYPSTVLTIGDQVTASGKVWKAYVEGMGRTSCQHPNANAVDDVPLPGTGVQYATRHNPFIYFHSLLDLGDCSNDDVSLDQLPVDLRTVAKTPRYSFIAPGLCDDASVSSCPGGQPAGLAGEDAFLRLWVPRILSSRAYKRDGALMIVFAPTTKARTTTTTAGTITMPPAGDLRPMRTGALILSRYSNPEKTLSATYNPYSLLRSLDDLFGYAPLVNAVHAKSFVKSALPGA